MKQIPLQILIAIGAAVAAFLVLSLWGVLVSFGHPSPDFIAALQDVLKVCGGIVAAAFTGHAYLTQPSAVSPTPQQPEQPQ